MTLIAAKVVMEGFCESRTVTVCVDVAVLPLPSVAVQVTVLGPLTKLAGDLVTVTVEQLSDALGAVSWELA